jgi:hypothetical protein
MVPWWTQKINLGLYHPDDVHMCWQIKPVWGANITIDIGYLKISSEVMHKTVYLKRISYKFLKKTLGNLF